MRYIRTKNQIIDEKMFDSPLCVFTREEVDTMAIAQADTLEELCDEFVMVNNADKQPFRISVKVINEMTYHNDDRCVYSGSSEYAFDFAKEKLEKVKEFCGTKENHDEYANYLYEENPDFKFTISLYGAIWTDKGLIFVAKLNSKGELELL